MNRREALASLVSLVGAAGTVQGADLPADGHLLAVVTVPVTLSEKAVESLRKHWEERWKGIAAGPIVVLREGVTLDLYDLSAKENHQ